MSCHQPQMSPSPRAGPCPPLGVSGTLTVCPANAGWAAIWVQFQVGAVGLALIPGESGCPCSSQGCLLCCTGGPRGWHWSRVVEVQLPVTLQQNLPLAEEPRPGWDLRL